MQVKPVGYRVLVEMVPAPPKTLGGIHIPEVAQEREKNQAIVVAVGEGRYLECGKLIAVPAKVGDRVLFSGRTIATSVPRGEDDPERHVVDADFIVGIETKPKSAAH